MTTLRLRLGTRASALARWQAHWVAAQLAGSDLEIELIPMTTRGDVTDRDPIGNIGSPGVFTKELQRALIDGQIDLAVHSLKDLPTDEVDGLVLAAVPERENTLDALISRHGESFENLPPGAAMGTGSLRRRAQLLHARGDLQMRDIRGNVDTRLQKLVAGQYDAIVLAYAGLKRLGLDQQITQILEPGFMLPAVGQGALAVETRADDVASRQALSTLDHLPTHQAVTAERTLLATLCGGCLAPIGAWARRQDQSLRLDAVVLSADGKQRISAWGTASCEEAAELGAKVAGELMAQGALELIEQARHPK